MHTHAHAYTYTQLSAETCKGSLKNPPFEDDPLGTNRAWIQNDWGCKHLMWKWEWNKSIWPQIKWQKPQMSGATPTLCWCINYFPQFVTWSDTLLNLGAQQPVATGCMWRCLLCHVVCFSSVCVCHYSKVVFITRLKKEEHLLSLQQTGLWPTS